MTEEPYPEFPVLLVDDEEHFLNSMKITLKSNGISNIECCSDSRNVMPKLQEKKYSLILLDILMPGFINGDKLLPEISREYPDIPVIMLTGTVIEDEKRKKYLNEGAVDYLEKTMPTDQSINTVQAALSNKKK
ncbi:MAG: response regulator [Acidobacteria bacterium]|jgi:DNA-binding NtrC family response regulator|nr:response regulator [Acidobacteriota bacterium]